MIVSGDGLCVHVFDMRARVETKDVGIYDVEQTTTAARRKMTEKNLYECALCVFCVCNTKPMSDNVRFCVYVCTHHHYYNTIQ